MEIKVIVNNYNGSTAYLPVRGAEMANELLGMLRAMNSGAVFTVKNAGEFKLYELPENVQNEVKSVLKCYNNCHVEYSNGEFHVCAGVALRAKYPMDFFVAGDYNVNDVYTKEEQEANFFECFGYHRHRK